MKSTNIKRHMAACTQNREDLGAGKVEIRQPIKKPRKTANCHNCDKTMRSDHIKKHKKVCTIDRSLDAANKVQIQQPTKKHDKTASSVAFEPDRTDAIISKEISEKKKRLLTPGKLLTIRLRINCAAILHQ